MMKFDYNGVEGCLATVGRKKATAVSVAFPFDHLNLTPEVPMKRIPLTQGKFAIVDNSDYKWLSEFKWCAIRGYSTFYAVRNIRENGRTIMFYMHRVILELKKSDKQQSDHIDGNGLNNRRSNLRICTEQQNAFNRKRREGSSQFKGVYWQKEVRKWYAHIKINQKDIYLGGFHKETDAAKAYDAAAIGLFGEFARVNFPQLKR